MATDTPPPCGLYRTTKPHPGKPESVPENRLVHFHNHSSGNKPIVLMPKANEHNVWTFHEKGFLVDELEWCHTLEPLPDEGMYTVQAPLQLGERALAEGQLVQLGYNGFGEAILFFPSKASSANALLLPDKGMKVERALLAQLRKVVLAGPQKVDPMVQ